MELCQSEMFLINKNQAIIFESNHRLKLPEHQLFLTIPDNELSIEEWLNQLKNENKLFSGDNNLFCETCGQRSDSEMVTESIEPHEILAFYNAKSKNPIENIPDVVSLGKNHYEIFGIIWYNRSHYIAYTREEGIWNEYNDNYVTTDKHPNPKNIYMLFYKKVIIN
ncbi:unnamed protein product [Blepharisma stoltei]|uniref:USP domain-containing protein n=1 Tax=Blepharisma stoltei TaxID=1481888 RepID=A0AAU9IKK0_9CILI|nr:unnamed protein product [Blepharisma stoltei]